MYPVQYEEIAAHANQFRHFDDIDDGFGQPDRMNLHAIIEYLLRPIYMEYLYVEFVCKCIYVYFTYT